MTDRITLALTGASGLPITEKLIIQLLKADRKIDLIYSDAAQSVSETEVAWKLSDDLSETQAQLCHFFDVPQNAITVHGKTDWSSPLASGSACNRAMIVCPASMGTIAKIAHGLSDDLLSRAADVTLKEKRQLILVPRETPMSAIHLDNLHRLASLGCTILPAMMSFYHQPKTIDDMIDLMVARILKHLNIASATDYQWGDRRDLCQRNPHD